MSAIEVVILSAIVLSAVAGVVLSLKREKKNGGCCGSCSQCKSACKSKDNQPK
ncbi:MAG: FeoB-associated Cys-rich membrane protein [Clostridia bacterium]|nr:FeoB-associated Cys-rich membrane protein [Clostridia bacterium]